MITRLLVLAAFPALYGQTLPDIRVDVNLVTVAASVSDRNGAPVQKLRREDFILLDNGQPREIGQLWQETDLPLTVGLIADMSGSQSGLFRKHRESIDRFLRQVIGPGDRAFIATVAMEARLVTDLTGSVDELMRGLENVNGGGKYGPILGEPCRGPQGKTRARVAKGLGCGGTALWNGVYAAARLKMKGVTGRKALIVFSDGMDTGSYHTVTDAIEASQAADTLVYTVKESELLMQLLVPAMAIKSVVSHGMERLSEETGGRAFKGRQDQSVMFAQMESELRSMYVLGFTPADTAVNGVAHKIEVKTKTPGMVVRARKSYSVPAR